MKKYTKHEYYQINNISNKSTITQIQNIQSCEDLINFMKENKTCNHNQRLQKIIHFAKTNNLSLDDNRIGNFICYLYVINIKVSDNYVKHYIYVGQSRTNDRYQNFNSYKKQPKVYKLLEKADSVDSYILCTNLSSLDADLIEIEVISFLDAMSEKVGANTLKGGKGFSDISEENKSKYQMKIYDHKGNFYSSFKSATDAAFTYNVPLSDITRHSLISDGTNTVFPIGLDKNGHQLLALCAKRFESLDDSIVISDVRIYRKHTPLSVKITNPYDKTDFKWYKTVAEAAEDLEVSRSTIYVNGQVGMQHRKNCTGYIIELFEK